MLPAEDRALLGDTMRGLNLDPETIDTLMSTLNTTAERIDPESVLNVNEAWFGGSHTGGYRLATNAGMADKAVREELAKMVAGIREMSKSVGQFAGDVAEVTESSMVTFKNYEAATECIAAPTFDGGQCALPGSSED